MAGFGIVLIPTSESPGLLQPGPPTRRLLSKSAASFASSGVVSLDTGANRTRDSCADRCATM